MGGEDLRDFLVLIETYWNVNTEEEVRRFYEEKVY